MRQRFKTLGQGGFIVGNIVYVIFAIIMTLLVFRLLLTFFGANPGNVFANFVYSTSAPLVAPFFGLFNYVPELGIARLEYETIVAIVVYGAIAGIFSALVPNRRG